MRNSSMNGLQKAAALSLITLIAIFFASHFSPGDAGGTTTGNATNATTFSGNGGGSFPDKCQTATSQQDAAKCAQDNIGALADQVGHNKIGINFTWTIIMGSFVLFMQAGFALLTTGLT
ncbi:MAG: hypothetical protein ACR2PL_24815, partial [Dehalococcoidia bacterium]